MVGVDIAKAIIDEQITERPVLVYGDPDVDGLMAMLLMCQFLDSKKVNYSYYINDKRQHGLKLSPSALRGYLVLAVDFDIPENLVQELVDNDVYLVSFDHHDIQDTFVDCTGKTGTRGIIINNQYPFEPADNTYQSGAGVVYEALCEVYPEFKSEEREAIVGITLLSDARPIENPKARKYLKTTYSIDPQKGYIGYLVESVIEGDYGFGLPRMDRNFIDFTFAPRVNSLLRFGKESEAVDFILGKGISSNNTRTRQADLVSTMRDRASFLELSDLIVVGVNSADFPDFKGVDLTGFIGLLCSNVKGIGKSVLGFVYDEGKIVRASFRGRYDDVPYRSGLEARGIEAKGHQVAFGILNFEPTVDTWREINTLVKELDAGHQSQVTIIETSNLSFIMLQMGMKVATENCYTRDMYRTYFKYTGNNAKVIRETYKTEPFSQEDYQKGVVPASKTGATCYKYILDADGNKIVKYIEYLIDGKKVKSFGVRVEDGLILPVLDKGHVQLYVREAID